MYSIPFGIQLMFAFHNGWLLRLSKIGQCNQNCGLTTHPNMSTIRRKKNVVLTWEILSILSFSISRHSFVTDSIHFNVIIHFHTSLFKFSPSSDFLCFLCFLFFLNFLSQPMEIWKRRKNRRWQKVATGKWLIFFLFKI